MSRTDLIDEALIEQLGERVFQCDDPVVLMAYSCTLVRISAGQVKLPKHYLHAISGSELNMFVVPDALILTPFMTDEELHLFREKYKDASSDSMTSLKMDLAEAHSFSLKLREFDLKPAKDDEPIPWNDINKTPYINYFAESTVSVDDTNIIPFPESFIDWLEFENEAYCILINGAIVLVPVPKDMMIQLSPDLLQLVNQVTYSSMFFTTNELMTTLFVRKLSKVIDKNLSGNDRLNAIKAACYEKITELVEAPYDLPDVFETTLISDRNKRLQRK